MRKILNSVLHEGLWKIGRAIMHPLRRFGPQVCAEHAGSSRFEEGCRQLTSTNDYTMEGSVGNEKYPLNLYCLYISIF